MAPRQDGRQRTPGPLLYIVAPVHDDAETCARLLAQAFDVTDIAAVLLRLPEGDERSLINRAKTIGATVQDRGVALLLDGRPDLVARSGADGAHLDGLEAFNEARGGLKPERIAGIGGVATRHDAMLAAEAGADYVMFGDAGPDGRRPSLAAIVERVSWWSEVFETPCVALARTEDEAAALAEAGADFVALDGFLWDDPAGPASAVASAARRLQSVELV